MKNKITLLSVAAGAAVAILVVAVVALVRGRQSAASNTQAPVKAVLVSNAGDPGWPRKITSGDTTILFYDPQIQK
ncbi:MAG TPA: hypothetical protein VJX67_01665, partial [Blastocatellia bacterium]|nr:hypothetical protein [Blastocatellia bacterium]